MGKGCLLSTFHSLKRPIDFENWKGLDRKYALVMYTVDGQKVPDVYRRLICQKVSVSRNLSQKVRPSEENFSCLYPTFTFEVITFK